MNQKFMVFLSVLLIIIAIIGLSLTIKANRDEVARLEREKAAKQDLKREVELLVLNRDVKVGQGIDLSYFDKKIIEVEDDNFEKDSGAILYSDDVTGLKGAIALENLSSDSTLKYSMFAKKGSAEYSKFRLRPKSGMFNLKFSLDERQFTLLSDLNPNELVDVYFKYETKLSDKEEGIAPKRKKKDDEDYSDEKGVTGVNFMPVFKAKRILYVEPKVEEVEELNDRGKVVKKKVELQNEANIYLELSRSEVKKVYALENLGNFIVLPASNDSDDEILSTNFVLPKEFIKEIRGGESDDAN